MEYQQILAAIRVLPSTEQNQLISELTAKAEKKEYISNRREKLINEQIGCPH